MKITDILTEYKRIKESLDGYNLVLIVGDTGTGKTEFIRDYFNDFPNFDVQYVDADTPKRAIKEAMLRKEYIYQKRAIVYDDTTISKDLLSFANESINPTSGSVMFVVIVNKVKSGFFIVPKNFIVHKVDYPTKNELLYFLNKIDLKDNKLKLELLKLERKSIRVIQMAIEDGYLSVEPQEDNGKYHVFKSNTFVLSFAIAENLARLKRFNNLLCEMDKYKKNEILYKDFVKIFYPSLDRMRLRYPKELLETIRNGKN